VQRRAAAGGLRSTTPKRWFVAVAAVLLTVAAGTGCGRKARPKKARPAPPEPIVPAASASAVLDESAAGWLADLPAATGTVAAGSTVWAALPEVGSNMASVGVFTVEKTGNDGISLMDKLGQRRRGVPYALVHEVRSSNRLEVGSVALCHSWTTSAMLARVVKVKGRHVLVQYDWSGATKQAVVEHAEPMRVGIEPLAFVGYPKFGRLSKGLVIALSDSRGWVLTGSGHVEPHRRSELVKLGIRSNPYRVGDSVRAYSWTGGFEQGTIREVVEPRVRYTVDLQGDRAPRPYFFADLVPSSPAP
jgi:hypothetical protein